jgi:predicted nucleotidyltransferase
VAGQSQRVLFEGEVEIDLIPFGGVASEIGILSCWPEDFHQEMDVSGFEGALRSADFRELQGTRVRCATPEAFVVLKLLSWNNQPERTKDAMDLAYMLREYVNLPRVMGMLWVAPHDDLLEKLGGDLERQGARLLGRNIGLQFPTSTTTKVRLIIEREIAGPSQRLANQMQSLKFPFDKVVEALADLRDGIHDVDRVRNSGMLNSGI